MRCKLASIHYVKNKREKISKCNICGNNTNLTWDHVPPKGAIFHDNVEMISIANAFNPLDKPPKVFSQNGMKFRTICNTCNNLIGSKFDVEFNTFIQELFKLVYLNFSKTEFVSMVINPEKIVKAVCGHLLAAKADLEDTISDEKMRDFVLGRMTHLDMNVYIWFYPYLENQVIRDILIGRFTINKTALISMLKCYPIAFIVTESDMFDSDFQKLNFDTNSSNSTFEFKLDISRVYSKEYPLIVDDKTIIMGGQSIQSACISRPK